MEVSHDSSQVFHIPPPDFSPEVHVAGCFCLHDGKFLIMKRNMDKPQGGTWGIPSGKQEKGEAIEQTAVRELREEAGIRVFQDDLSLLGKLFVRLVRHDTGQKTSHDYTYTLFSVDMPKTEKVVLNPQEHSEWLWTRPSDISSLQPLIFGAHEAVALFERQNSGRL